MEHNSSNREFCREGLRKLSVPMDVFMPALLEQLSTGKSVEILCRGNSMNPFLVDRRDSIVLSACTYPELRMGDVVLGLTDSGHWVVHRVVSLKPLLLNGDGNLQSSREYIPENQVYARMVAYVRKGRRAEVSSPGWRRWSAFWKFCGKVSVGSWSLRRVLLGLWRRIYISRPSTD